MGKINFEPPAIIGAISEGNLKMPREMRIAFSKFKPRIAFLPFCVEKKYLKNTIACMQLMDIAGLVILGTHQKDIASHITHLDKISSEARLVDTIIRKGKNFLGVNAAGMACIKWLGHLPAGSKKIAVILGNDPIKLSVLAALKIQKFKILKEAGLATNQDHIIMIDLRNKPSRTKYSKKHILSKKTLMGLFYQTTVELLTAQL